MAPTRVPPAWSGAAVGGTRPLTHAAQVVWGYRATYLPPMSASESYVAFEAERGLPHSHLRPKHHRTVPARPASSQKSAPACNALKRRSIKFTRLLKKRGPALASQTGSLLPALFASQRAPPTTHRPPSLTFGGRFAFIGTFIENHLRFANSPFHLTPVNPQKTVGESGSPTI
jgi:hypothetical protein